MAVPSVTATVDKGTPYAPGAALVTSWTVVDGDNSSERLVLKGVDGQGNQVTVLQDILRQDTFTMTEAYWERTGATLAIDNVNRRATGVMPTA